MNTYKIILFSLSLLCVFTSGNSQHSDVTGIDSLATDKDFIRSEEIQGFDNETTERKAQNPFKINYFAGTDYSWSGLFGSSQGIHAGAEGSYTLSPRFRLSMGSFVRFARLSNVPSFLSSEPIAASSSFNSTTMGLYVQGDYLLTPRLTLTGVVFKEYSPYRNENINPMFLNTNREGVSFQLNYKILENLHFGARFDYIKNDNPYNPFGTNRSVIDNYFW